MKLVGCVIVLVFSTLIGFAMAGNEAEKLTTLEEIYCFVQKLVFGVKRRITMDEIVHEYILHKSPRHICGKNRDEILLSLSKAKKAGQCAKEAEKCIQLIETISKSADTAEIEKQCSAVSEDIYDSLANLRRENGKKRELYVKLGAALGLLVCICVL